MIKTAGVGVGHALITGSLFSKLGPERGDEHPGGSLPLTRTHPSGGANRSSVPILSLKGRRSF